MVNRVDVFHRPVDEERKGKGAGAMDYTRIFNSDTDVYIKGKKEIAFRILHKTNMQDLRWACLNVKYSKLPRTAGMVSHSTTFGFMPRRALLQDFCHSCSMAKKEPEQHFVFEHYAMYAQGHYAYLFPEQYCAQSDWVNANISNDWTIGDSIWTSGIVNKENYLAYHKDNGNEKNSFSVMFVFSKGIQGGNLVIPGLRIAFAPKDCVMLIFQGVKHLHGVTPIITMENDAYRRSVVYYTMGSMKNCGTPTEEVERIRKVKLQREVKRLHNGSKKES